MPDPGPNNPYALLCREIESCGLELKWDHGKRYGCDWSVAKVSGPNGAAYSGGPWDLYKNAALSVQYASEALAKYRLLADRGNSRP